MSIETSLTCHVCHRTDRAATTVDEPVPFADWTRVRGVAVCPRCMEGRVLVEQVRPIVRGTA